MLAGFSSSSTLLSPRHRLRSEASEQFQACHFPSMSTQRLDLPCNFLRKDASSRPQAGRPVVGISIEKKPSEAATSNLKQSICLPPLHKRCLKRCFKSSDDEEAFVNRAKRKRGQLGSGNFWFRSGDEGEEEVYAPGEASGSSSTSSETRGLFLDNPTTLQGTTPSRANPGESSAPAQNEQDNNGVELIRLLVACVEAVTSKNLGAVHHCIARLGELSSPKGLPVSRLISYFTEALALRVSWNWPHIFQITPPRELDPILDDGTAFRFLNQVTPIPKFIHFTSNEILLRVFEGKERVHIIDFDIKQGLQWPSLFQSLASRTNPPSHIRITGIGESKQELLQTGDRLAGFAEKLNLSFEFHPVVDGLEDVRLWMLHVKEGEAVAVNCMLQMHKVLYDGSGRALTDFLGLIRSTNPIAVVIAEQEGDHNEATLESRIVNSLKYYAAVFDSLDSSLPLDSPGRVKIEAMFGREIRNIVACEGQQRTERHSGFGTWRKVLMEKGNLRCVGITDREFLQSQMLLKMHCVENYKVERKGKEGLSLSWEDQTLYTVSAWTPFDIAGSSSS